VITIVTKGETLTDQLIQILDYQKKIYEVVDPNLDLVDRYSISSFPAVIKEDNSIIYRDEIYDFVRRFTEFINNRR
jgi:hypothetical protein